MSKEIAVIAIFAGKFPLILRKTPKGGETASFPFFGLPGASPQIIRFWYSGQALAAAVIFQPYPANLAQDAVSPGLARTAAALLY